MRILPSAVLALALLPPPLVAQGRGRAPVVLDLAASTSALALGNAFQLSGRSSDAIFYNPALLVRATGFGGAWQRFSARASLFTVSGASDWWKGGVGVGLQALSYATDASDPGAISEGEGDLLSGGSIAVSELVATVGYAQELVGVRWGVAGKVVEQRMGGSKDALPAADLGASKTLGPVTLGLAAQNLGPDLELGGTSVDLANRVTLGADYRRRPVGPLDIGASASVTRVQGGAILPALGLEVAWWPVIGRTFIGRIGIRRVDQGPAKEITFGGAFMGDEISIEYAYQGFDQQDGAHRFGVSWR